MRRVVVDIGIVALNLVLHVIGLSAIGLNGIYRLLFEAMGLGRVAPGFSPSLTQAQALTVAACGAAVLGGAVSALWSRKALLTAVPAALAYLVVLTALAISMFLVDKGDPAIMWQYVLPRWSDALPALIVGVAAGLGWYGTHRYRSSRRTTATSTMAEA